MSQLATWLAFSVVLNAWLAWAYWHVFASCRIYEESLQSAIQVMKNGEASLREAAGMIAERDRLIAKLENREAAWPA